jgi:putative hydroxymethylpyrimidine transport system substrate-binding protein
MALKSSGITRPKDLVGKSVGYPGIPSQEAFLATMLESDGASLDDIELVNVEFNLVPAVISGNVAAAMGPYWTHETILAEREGYPVNVLRVEQWGVPDYYELVLVANESTVRDKSEMVRRFLGAVERGYEGAIADPGAAVNEIAKAYPETDLEVESAGIELLVPVWREPGVPFGTQTAERWTALGDWMKSKQLIPADLKVDAAYRLDLLPTPADGTPIAIA